MGILFYSLSVSTVWVDFLILDFIEHIFGEEGHQKEYHDQTDDSGVVVVSSVLSLRKLRERGRNVI